MKKYHLLLLFLACSYQMTAQNNQAYYFTAEGEKYIEVRHAIPSSSIASYSEKGGGKHITTVTTDAEGGASIKQKVKEPVSFVVNIDNPLTNVQGNKKVVHLNNKEFVFENLNLKQDDLETTIQWDAAFDDTKEYNFAILSSTDGIHYETIKNIAPYSKDMQSYSIAVDNIEGRFYQINIQNSTKKINYLSTILEKNTNIIVYPTVFKNIISIDGMNDGRYSLQTVTGSIVNEGVITSQLNKIQTSDLFVGIYLLTIFSENKMSTYKLYTE